MKGLWASRSQTCPSVNKQYNVVPDRLNNGNGLRLEKKDKRRHRET